MSDEDLPKSKDIVIVTSVVDAKRREKLKAAHVDFDASYHFLSIYELPTKVRGLTLAGLVLDNVKWKDLTEAGKAACQAAALTVLHKRGLKKVEELITIVY